VAINIEAEAEEDIEGVRQSLEAARDSGFKASPQATPDEIVDSFRSSAIGMLEKAGFGTEDISDGDVQINFEFDFNSGRRFATQRRLHDFSAGAEDSIAKNVFKALAGLFEKGSNDIAEEIERAVAASDTVAILAIVRSGDEKGAFMMQPTNTLLDALFSFDITQFDDADRKFISERRLCVAHLLKRWDLTGAEAETLLRDYPDEYDDRQKTDLEMQLANAIMHKGHCETALIIWHKLLRSPDKLEPGNRGWAWSNIALASPPESVEKRHAAKCSADAFLEAGDKEQASRSLMMLADALLFEEPGKALDTIEEIVNLIEENGLRNRSLRAATYHARGNRLLRMGRHAEAAADATKAAGQLRGVMGAEEQLISALHLAAIAYAFIDDRIKAETSRQEADKLTEKTGSSHFKMARRVQVLLQEFDAVAAADLLRDAEREGNQEIIATIPVVQAMQNAALSDVQRLSMLEDGLLKLDRARAPEGMKQPGRLALATLLEKVGQPERAEIWYQKVLSADPFNRHARDALIRFLWDRERWGDAALVLKQQLDLRGPMPGLLYGYGRSLSEAGNYSGAVPVLTQALNLAKGNEDLANRVHDLREQALNKGGTILPVPPQKPSSAAITREEFDAALAAFARYISGEKRMTFWTRKDNEEAWVKRPEKHAQNLLHTFLKASFLERVNLFEELDSGAGRLDLYVQLYGGLNIIVELKMCGFNYSSNYAAAGETQILHYMQNRDSKLGYLLVFDARLTMNGQELLKGDNSFTLFSKFIDMRPRVSAR